MHIPSFSSLLSLRATAEKYGFVHEAAAQQKSRAQQREAEDLLFCDDVGVGFDNDRVTLSQHVTDEDYLLHVELLFTENESLKVISIQREDICPPTDTADLSTLIF